MGIHLHTHITNQEFVLIKTTSETFVKLRFGEVGGGGGFKREKKHEKTTSEAFVK